MTPRTQKDTLGFDRLERMRWIKHFKTQIALLEADTRGN